jgi:hypothetical protein
MHHVYWKLNKTVRKEAFTKSGNGAKVSDLSCLKEKSLSTPWTHIGRVEVQRYSFLILPLKEGEWSASRPGRFTPGIEPRYPQNSKSGGPQSRPGRYRSQKSLTFVGIRTPDRLYRLRHRLYTLSKCFSNKSTELQVTIVPKEPEACPEARHIHTGRYPT